MGHKKGRYGDGSVFLHGQTWTIQYYNNGYRIRESSHSANRADAVRLLKRRLAQIHTGLYDGPPQKQIRFEDLAELIRTDYRINQRRSIKRLEISLKHLQSFFGGMRVGQITMPTINAYIEYRLEKGLAPGTINRELTALKRSLNLAKMEGHIKSIPHVKMLKEANARQGFLEHEQYLIILENLPLYLKPLFILDYITGLRRSEILSLTWDRVHLKEGYIRLQASDTKTAEARTIYLPREGTDALKQAMKNRVLGCELVFHRKGRRIVNFSKSWAKACEAAGVPGLLFHDLRRTAIRNLVRAGVPERVAMAISGHKTRSVFDRYDIVSERDLREAATKLGNYLSKSQENNVAQHHEGRR